MKTAEFDIRTYEPAIGVEINYIQGLSGKNMLVLKESDVKVIVGLLLQTDFSDQEFVMDEMNVGAICEVMNQMMGAAATALSQFLSRSINISPPKSFEIGDSEQFKEKYFDDLKDIVAVYFNLMIGDLVNSQFIYVMPISLAKELISFFGLNVSQDPNNGLLSPKSDSSGAVPAARSTPAAPAAPAAPAVSAAPSTPAAPAAPAAPAVSAAPSTPVVPAAPAAPAVSTAPRHLQFPRLLRRGLKITIFQARFTRSSTARNPI